MEETIKINWYKDYLINESLNESAKSIVGTLSRLSFNNPNHTDFQKWETEFTKWSDFRHSLCDLVIEDKAKAEKLVDDVFKVNKSYLDLEQTLFSKNSLKPTL